MRVYFHTNLDEPKECGDMLRLNEYCNEGDAARAIPRKGERILFTFSRGEGRLRHLEYELEVVAVSYDYSARSIRVELHMPSYYSMSIADWSAWFKRHRLGKDY